MRDNAAFQFFHVETIAFQKTEYSASSALTASARFTTSAAISIGTETKPLSSPCNRSPGEMVKPQIDTVTLKSMYTP